MSLTKPTVDSATWGNTNTSSPDMVTPGAGLVNTGFLAPPTLPKRGHMNWLLNKLHQGLRYYMAQGVPAWDGSETNYAVGSIVTFSGLAYILNSTPAAGTNPTVDTAHWGSLVPLQPGTLLRTTRVFTSGAGSIASIAGCKRAFVRICAGGAGSAGAAVATYGVAMLSPGGGAGGYAELDTTSIPVSWTWNIGAGGAAGASTPTLGTAGGNTTFADGAVTVTAFGGLATTNISALAAAGNATTSTNGTRNLSGGVGRGGVQGAQLYGDGTGGTSLMEGVGGTGSLFLGGDHNASQGVGPGAGASGAWAGAVSASGAAGQPGGIIIQEYA